MKNEEIDRKILEAIDKGIVRNMSIHFSDTSLKLLNFRKIDSRLQFLRKAGKIKFTQTTGWSRIPGD